MGLTYIDSCVIIYAVEEDRVWGEPSKVAIAQATGGQLAISPLVKLECLAGPFKNHDAAAETLLMEFFKQLQNLDLPEAVYLKASQLRARFNLKTPDALHLACAQHHRCEALWTNDARLNRASHGLARNIFA